MTNTAELHGLQGMAQLLLQWLQDPSRDLAVDQPLLEGMGSLMGFTITPAQVTQLGSRLRVQASFPAYREDLLSRWLPRTDRNGRLDDDQSRVFISDFIGSIDHAIFFEQGITASVTHTRRGAINDTDMQFTGSMPCWTLHLTTSGKGLYLNEQMEVEAERGCLLLIHPDARYHYGLHPGSDEWEHLWVLFQPRPNWESWLNWPTVDNGIGVLSLLDEQASHLVEQLFRRLIALRGEPDAYRSDLEHNCLEELLIRSRQFALEATQDERDQRVRKACDYMEQHLADRFSVEDVAAACNLSSSRLAHLFKEHMGVSPKSWSNTRRLQMARRLLLASPDPIASVAAQVGYDDPTQFSKYFSKNVGCSPREFRRSFKDPS